MTESSRRTDPSLIHALELASEALAVEPAGLMTDFDGTLSPIVADPASARLVDGATDALVQLTRRLAVVAVVTGRAPLDARRMTGVPGLLIAGNHGTEWLEPDAAEPTASPQAAQVRDLLDAVIRRVPQLPGTSVEEKGISATVHYRNATSPEAARAAIIEGIGDVGEGLELRPGRMSLELRPVGLGDKGAATRAIIDRFGLRSAVVMGDDVSDVDMFRAVEERRSTGQLRGVVIAVQAADGEVPPEVADAADAVLHGPESAARFLAGL